MIGLLSIRYNGITYLGGIFQIDRKTHSILDAELIIRDICDSLKEQNVPVEYEKVLDITQELILDFSSQKLVGEGGFCTTEGHDTKNKNYTVIVKIIAEDS